MQEAEVNTNIGFRKKDFTLYVTWEDDSIDDVFKKVRTLKLYEMDDLDGVWFNIDTVKKEIIDICSKIENTHNIKIKGIRSAINFLKKSFDGLYYSNSENLQEVKKDAKYKGITLID